MPRTIRFHLDEHVAHAVADGLRRRGAEVTTTTDAGLISPTDQQQFAYAHAQGRVMCTEDRDFLAMAATGAAPRVRPIFMVSGCRAAA
jgi:predicted nuclease of predicted toxin-antitoxin system